MNTCQLLHVILITFRPSNCDAKAPAWVIAGISNCDPENSCLCCCTAPAALSASTHADTASTPPRHRQAGGSSQHPYSGLHRARIGWEAQQGGPRGAGPCGVGQAAHTVRCGQPHRAVWAGHIVQQHGRPGWEGVPSHTVRHPTPCGVGCPGCRLRRASFPAAGRPRGGPRLGAAG